MRVRPWTILLLAVLAVAPAASAQTAAPTVAVEVAFPGEALHPFVDEAGFPSRDEVRAALPVRVTYTVPANSVLTGNGQVRLDVPQAPIWLTVSPVPASHTVPLPAGVVTAARTFTFESVALVWAKASAPALTNGTVEIMAVSAGEPLLPSARDTDEGTVAAAPYVVLRSSTLTPTVEVRPGEATEVEVRVANTGNALVAARVEVAHADEGLVVTPPAMPVVLRPNPLKYRVDDEARIVPVAVRHTAGSGGEVVLLVKPVADPGGTVHESVVRLHVAVREPAGAPAVPLLLAVLVGGALVAMRRR